MRLISLTIGNYRVHEDCRIEFDPSRQLIGGPNESGKSTIVEAIHRALFLKAKTGGSLQRDMVSTSIGGHPEVTLVFEEDGQRWELEKRFAGSARGSTRLRAEGGATLIDEAAESKLEEILGLESVGGRGAANQLAAIWSHLWVWQGSSGGDPAEHAGKHKDRLVHRLQQDGLGAVMESEVDQQVRDRVTAAYAEDFTATGKIRAGSRVELAGKRVEEAQAKLLGAKESSDRLERAIDSHNAAEAAISELEKIVPGIRRERTEVEAKLSKVRELRLLEESRLLALKAAAATRKSLRLEDEKIRKLQSLKDESDKTLQPAITRQVALGGEEAKLRKEAGAAEQMLRNATDRVRVLRLGLDISRLRVALMEKAATHQRLLKKSAELSKLRKQQDSLGEARSKLPVIPAAELEKLRCLERTASQARTRLEAMATGLELLESSVPVTIDGEALPALELRVVAEEAELLVGKDTRIRIRPGGGSSLLEARGELSSAQKELAAVLDRLGVKDLDEASSFHEKREGLSRDLEKLESKWMGLGGEAIDEELANCLRERDSAAADLERRQASAGGEEQTVTSAEAAEELGKAEAVLNEAESAESKAQQAHEHAKARQQIAAEELQRNAAAVDESRQSLRDLEIKIGVMEDRSGDPGARQEEIGKAVGLEETEKHKLDEIRSALAALTPDELESNHERLTRALNLQEERRRDAEGQLLVARSQLTLDGSSDPRAELEKAQVSVDDAERQWAFEERRARSVEKLHQLFGASREALDQRLVQPLVERIGGYLECVFGPGTLLGINLTDTGIQALELQRKGHPAHPFSALSGGAREQVAAAVRLAMAEILASDHGGCLPVVFDDAFAFSDSRRIQSLQRMLDLASQRGLQVIVVSHTPSDYAGLGATEFQLPA